MSDPTSAQATADRDRLAELADEFLRRHRAGEGPSVDEYVHGHPELANDIRDLFPAMMAMEQRGFDATLDPSPPAERPGSTIGRYKLLERIGEGGFGVVYVAEQQQPVRRKVALKVVKPGMDSRQVLARFEAERQALAIMDHPHIAKVFDGGMTDSGRPYFVMELVKGVPITAYCDEKQLPPRERLELFVQVCQAVQHAHQKGIIHRDLKPSNALVSMHDTTPVVKVIDFGVAKALGQELTDKTVYTGLAQFLGTPLYMSPEQAGESSLDVDTRSDIYSLGVLLYELLTGTTPFDKERFKQAAHDEIRRIIREEEPPKPSTRLSESKESLASISAQRHIEPAKLTKLVRGELDWIVMKALEKDRARRYETANGFARDVERYLHDEPVAACPPSAAYRFKKFARRNKGILAASAAVVAALLLGTAASTWQAVRATRYAQAETKALALAQANERAASENAARAEAARERAEKSFREARLTIKWVLADAVAGDGKWSAVPLPVRKILAEDAVAFYMKFVKETDPEPAIRLETASSLRAIALMRERVGEVERAEKTYRRSIDILMQLLAQFSTNREYRTQLVLSHRLLADLLQSLERLEEAAESYRRAGKLCEGLLDESFDPDHLTELARCYSGLMRIDPSSQNVQSLCASILRRLEESESRLHAGNRENAQPLMAIAWLLATAPDPTQRRLLRAVELARRAFEIVPNYQSAWVALGMAHYRAGDWKAAVAALEKSVTLRIGDDPWNRLFLAMAHWQLGNQEEARRQYDLATAAIEQYPSAGLELRRVRAEAASLLNVEDSATDAAAPNRSVTR